MGIPLLPDSHAVDTIRSRRLRKASSPTFFSSIPITWASGLWALLCCEMACKTRGSTVLTYHTPSTQICNIQVIKRPPSCLRILNIIIIRRRLLQLRRIWLCESYENWRIRWENRVGNSAHSRWFPVAQIWRLQCFCTVHRAPGIWLSLCVQRRCLPVI